MTGFATSFAFVPFDGRDFGGRSAVAARDRFFRVCVSGDAPGFGFDFVRLADDDFVFFPADRPLLGLPRFFAGIAASSEPT